MVVRCSRTAAPRAAPDSRLDPSDPRAPCVRTSGTRRHADPASSPVVYLVSRSRLDRNMCSVRVQSRVRDGGEQESNAPTPPSGASQPGPGIDTAARAPVDWRADDAHRTHVRSVDDGDVGDDRVDASSSGLQRLMLRIIVWYQRGAEGRPSPCRFFPSCSEYGHVAIRPRANFQLASLAVRRLLRCRPLGPSGYDPVPLPAEKEFR